MNTLSCVYMYTHTHIHSMVMKNLSLNIYTYLWYEIFLQVGEGKAGTYYIGTECPRRLIKDTLSRRVNMSSGKAQEALCSIAELLKAGFPDRPTIADTRAQGESEASNSCSKAMLSQLCSLKPSEGAERDANFPLPACHFAQSRFTF